MYAILWLILKISDCKIKVPVSNCDWTLIKYITSSEPLQPLSFLHTYNRHGLWQVHCKQIIRLRKIIWLTWSLQIYWLIDWLYSVLRRIGNIFKNLECIVKINSHTLLYIPVFVWRHFFSSSSAFSFPCLEASMSQVTAVFPYFWRFSSVPESASFK